MSIHFDAGQAALSRPGLSSIIEDVGRTRRLRRNPASAEGRARATGPTARLAAFVLAVLVAFSLASLGTAHAHAGSIGEAHAVSGHSDIAESAPHDHQGHAHAVPCDDDGSQAGPGDCCMSASSCALCVPVPAAEFAFATSSGLVAPVRLSASLPRDSATLSRPPKLSVPA
jgi:hypothetical protein